jgi:hypothetical protein
MARKPDSIAAFLNELEAAGSGDAQLDAASTISKTG